MQSKAKTVSEYLKELAPERRKTISTLRKVIKQNLPTGFKEGMQYGMIGYFVPHRLYPAGYHCNPEEPLPYICLASQKNHCSLYLYAQYSSNEENQWFQNAWKDAGKKMDMGKSCVRFKNAEDVPLDVIAEAVGRLSVQEYVNIYESALKPKASNRRQPRQRASESSKRIVSRTGKKVAATTKSAQTRRTKKKVAQKRSRKSQ